MENKVEKNQMRYGKPSKKEIEFLKGPQSRGKEFWFLITVIFEFIKGFRKLHFVGPCVTVFGSARLKEDHPYYIKTRELSARIAQLGFTVMTGGGPGLMEAANRGAKDVGGRSVGCNITLPMEQQPNPYLDTWMDFKYFFVRKVLLNKYSYAFVVMPGGFGTMDEFFEALTLIQTNKMKRFPVVLMEKDFFQLMMDHIDLMKAKGTIGENDLDLFLFTDDIEEAIQHIENAVDKFGLTREKEFKPFAWLG